MKMRELISVMQGNENLKIKVDGEIRHCTTQHVDSALYDREIGTLMLEPNIYIGMIIVLK